MKRERKFLRSVADERHNARRRAKRAEEKKRGDVPIPPDPPPPPPVRKAAPDRNARRRAAAAKKKAIAEIADVVDRVRASAGIPPIAESAAAEVRQPLTDFLSGYGLWSQTARAIRTVAKALGRPEEAIIAGMLSAEFLVPDQVLDMVVRADVRRKTREAEEKGRQKAIDARIAIVLAESEEDSKGAIESGRKRVERLSALR